MYTVLALVLGAALSAGWHLDNDIPGGFGPWWWLGLVVSWFVVTLSPVLRRSLHRVWIVVPAAVLLGLVTRFYDATMTAYLAGAVMLLMTLFSRRLGGGSGGRTTILVTIAVASSLVWMPVPLNRVTVKLPNLSAGTYLTLQASPDRDPLPDGRFFNRLDDHQELRVGLGTQIWVDYPHEPPLLRIDILREKIVIRLLSISYESRIAYLDLPMGSIEGDDLMQLKDSGLGQPFGMQMEKGRLLIDGLSVDQPAWVQLPAPDGLPIPVAERIVVILVRLLVWLIVAAGVILWSPFLMERKR